MKWLQCISCSGSVQCSAWLPRCHATSLSCGQRLTDKLDKQSRCSAAHFQLMSTLRFAYYVPLCFRIRRLCCNNLNTNLTERTNSLNHNHENAFNTSTSKLTCLVMQVTNHFTSEVDYLDRHIKGDSFKPIMPMSAVPGTLHWMSQVIVSLSGQILFG